ncbi:hypothetical protein [Benzoatithermus flavus]|uniref:Uncharacterized protein n=1 Tax=Benzoatithermus flavus TaxID=3108223 RepID=A0ABU8XS22_9PROT
MPGRHLAAALLGLLLAVGASASAFAQNLTGVWVGNDGGTYYVRQINQVVWWYGENALFAPGFSNVAKGEVSQGQVFLLWADVPKGRTSSNGALVLQIQSPTRLVALQRTGGFGGSVWTRIR